MRASKIYHYPYGPRFFSSGQHAFSRGCIRAYHLLFSSSRIPCVCTFFSTAGGPDRPSFFGVEQSPQSGIMFLLYTSLRCSYFCKGGGGRGGSASEKRLVLFTRRKIMGTRIPKCSCRLPTMNELVFNVVDVAFLREQLHSKQKYAAVA